MSDDSYETGYRNGENSANFDWRFALEEFADIPEGVELDTESPGAVADYLRGLHEELANWRRFAEGRP